MKNKKCLLIAFICVIMCGVLCACNGKKGSSHTHESQGDWDRDGKTHWEMCECGEKVNSAKHKLDDLGVCTVCGSEVFDYGDSIDVYNYDEYGNIVRVSVCDEKGKLQDDYVHEYVYDEDGNILRMTEYENGEVVGEEEYIVTATGENYITKYIGYGEDGTRFVNEYDEFGNVVKAVWYDKDDNVIGESQSEYANDDTGELYEVKCTEKYEDGTMCIAEYNIHGDAIKRVFYDADGNIKTEETYEYTYNDEDIRVYEKCYSNGVLDYEAEYTVVEEEDGIWSYQSKYIEYEEDGSANISYYDEEGNEIE